MGMDSIFCTSNTTPPPTHSLSYSVTCCLTDLTAETGYILLYGFKRERFAHEGAFPLCKGTRERCFRDLWVEKGRLFLDRRHGPGEVCYRDACVKLILLNWALNLVS